MKIKLLAAAILIAFGIVRMPIEAGLSRQQKALHYHGATMKIEMRQHLPQIAFVAALSGFRSLVADALYLKAYTAWQRTEWGRLKTNLDSVTALQPRSVMFWDMASWHMAFNAAAAARDDEEQPREALRIKAEREYWKLGEDFLIRGIQNNPDRAALFERLGDLYSRKFEDHEKAYQAYHEASLRPDAMGYVHRMAFYELAKVPGREREAYEGLKKLYLKGENERLPTLLNLLRQMEEKLNVPPAERIYSQPPKNP